MEARPRPAVEEAPAKRARTASPAALPPLSDELTASIMRLLPPLTQLRVVPLVCHAWNRLLWTSVIEHLDLQPFRERLTDATVIRIFSKCPQLRSLSLKHCGTPPIPPGGAAMQRTRPLASALTRAQPSATR